MNITIVHANVMAQLSELCEAAKDVAASLQIMSENQQKLAKYMADNSRDTIKLGNEIKNTKYILQLSSDICKLLSRSRHMCDKAQTLKRRYILEILALPVVSGDGANVTNRDTILYESITDRLFMRRKLTKYLNIVNKLRSKIRDFMVIICGDDVPNLLSNTEYIPISQSFKSLAKEKLTTVCQCNAELVKDLCTPELYCSECGKYAPNNDCDISMNTDKRSQTTLQELKHFNKWWNKILGGGIEDCPNACLQKIAYIIARDGYKPHQLNCATMRVILADPYVNGSKYNSITTALIVKFGGTPPPEFTEADRKLVSSKFVKVIQIHIEMSVNVPHRPCYPFYVWQIIRHIYEDNPDKLRILGYIHLQSNESITRNGIIYAKICKKLGRTETLKYYKCEPLMRLSGNG